MPLRFALTCDDAPTLQAKPDRAPPDATRLDTIRELLLKHGIRHCLAFVIGAEAKGGADGIRRWIDAGFEVGNHTFSHRRASSMTPAEYLADVERCHLEMESIGALPSDSKRYFRFPYLDRGKSQHERSEVRSGLAKMGYTTVHATVDFYDHEYEAPMARAAASGDEQRLRRIEDRYVQVATRALCQRAALLEKRHGKAVVQIPYFHFGLVSTRSMTKLLGRLAELNAESRPIAEGVEEPIHKEFEADVSRNGLISDWDLSRSLFARGVRKLARLSHRHGFFGQAAEGPRWPYLG